MKYIAALITLLVFTLGHRAPAADWVVYEGKDGPGRGQHIVFLTGDEEYRSEEGLPQLAKILAVRHGFKCTVLFSINPQTGEIDPNNSRNEPGLEALDRADLCVLLLRFRSWPDEQMKHFVDYYLAGKPFIALRTATHSFTIGGPSEYKKFTWNNKEWPGGFGQQVLGDTWISHHGNHGSESTRGVFNEAFKDLPIMKGVDDIWGPTDVYGVTHLPADAKVLVHGQVLAGMKPDAAPVAGKKNEPMMPVAWIREHKNENGKTNRILTTTMGASTDLQSEGLRRLIVNGAYWAVGLEGKIPAKNNVEIVGEYKPTPFGFNKFTKGVKPADHEWK